MIYKTDNKTIIAVPFDIISYAHKSDTESLGAIPMDISGGARYNDTVQE